MPCTVFNLNGPFQSGKTTLAVSMLRGLQAEGIVGVVICQTPDMATLFMHRYPGIRALTVAQLGAGRRLPIGVRVVVVEEAKMSFGPQYSGAIQEFKRQLDILPGPTQMLLVNGF